MHTIIRLAILAAILATASIATAPPATAGGFGKLGEDCRYRPICEMPYTCHPVLHICLPRP